MILVMRLFVVPMVRMVALVVEAEDALAETDAELKVRD
jgi:hypothetical protein